MEERGVTDNVIERFKNEKVLYKFSSFRMCFLHSETLHIMGISFTKLPDFPKVS